MKYENLQIFRRIDSKTSYRAIQVAIVRSGVYRKPIVVLKLLAVFALVTLISFGLFGSFSVSLVVGVLVLSSLNQVILRSEFDKYVKPLIPSCLADVQRFPDIRK